MNPTPLAVAAVIARAGELKAAAARRRQRHTGEAGPDRECRLGRSLSRRARQVTAADAAHQADLAYSQIERLVNLGALPPDGFQVASFPLRIEGAGAAPARVVAIVPE
jgi:hypothetical protein